MIKPSVWQSVKKTILVISFHEFCSGPRDHNAWRCREYYWADCKCHKALCHTVLGPTGAKFVHDSLLNLQRNVFLYCCKGVVNSFYCAHCGYSASETYICVLTQALTMTLTLKTANQSSCITLWPTMMHHPTKFGDKRFSSWGGGIVQANIHWNFEPFFFFTLILTTTEQSNLFTRQSSLWWYAIKPSLVAKGLAVQKTYQISHFDHMFLHCDLDLEGQQTNLFGKQSS